MTCLCEDIHDLYAAAAMEPKGYDIDLIADALRATWRMRRAHRSACSGPGCKCSIVPMHYYVRNLLPSAAERAGLL